MSNGIDPDLIKSITDFLRDGHTLAELADWTDGEEEALYGLAHRLYSNGRYGQALQAFGMLLIHHHTDRRYHLGFGACLQMQGEFERAIQYYGAALALDLSDPEAPFHLAECLLARGKLAEARDILKFTVAAARLCERHASIGSRAAALLQALQSRIEEGRSASRCIDTVGYSQCH